MAGVKRKAVDEIDQGRARKKQELERRETELKQLASAIETNKADLKQLDEERVKAAAELEIEHEKERAAERIKWIAILRVRDSDAAISAPATGTGSADGDSDKVLRWKAEERKWMARIKEQIESKQASNIKGKLGMERYTYERPNVYTTVWYDWTNADGSADTITCEFLMPFHATSKTLGTKVDLHDYYCDSERGKGFDRIIIDLEPRFWIAARLAQLVIEQGGVTTSDICFDQDQIG